MPTRPAAAAQTWLRCMLQAILNPDIADWDANCLALETGSVISNSFLAGLVADCDTSRTSLGMPPKAFRLGTGQGLNSHRCSWPLCRLSRQ